MNGGRVKVYYYKSNPIEKKFGGMVVKVNLIEKNKNKKRKIISIICSGEQFRAKKGQRRGKEGHELSRARKSRENSMRCSDFRNKKTALEQYSFWTDEV